MLEAIFYYMGVQIAQLVERWTATKSNRVQVPVMPTKTVHIFSGPPCPPSSDWVAGSPEIWWKVLCDRLASYPKCNKQLLLVRLTLQKPG